MKHRHLFFLAFLLLPLFALAQSTCILRGTVIGASSHRPMAGVNIVLMSIDPVSGFSSVSIPGVTKGGITMQTTSDARGSFQFRNLVPGKYTLQLNAALIAPRTVTAVVKEAELTQLDPIAVNELTANEDVSMIGVIDAGVVDDDVDNAASQDVNATVLLSNDVFLNRTTYQLSPFRFSARGYDGTQEEKFINGVSFNDQNRGLFNYASIGALNDMTRNGDVTNFTAPGTFTFGSLGGAENINMRAGSYTPGSKLTLSYTNRNYYLRGMYTYATGLNSRGWAVATSIGGRYSDQGNIEGTFYNNVSFAFAAEKQWKGGQHSLSFTAFVSPVQRGQQGNSYQEVYDLVDNNLYNPNWGYQNGKKRNAKVVTAFDPTAVISHLWKINENTTLTTGLGAHYARYGNTALNWYNGPDPRPDYYRYLPSYFTSEVAQAEYRNLWQSKDPQFTQINWDKLYMANANNLRAGNGAAIYMVEERRSDLLETSLNSTLNHRYGQHFNLTGGIGVRYSLSRQFKTVDDLLGADYVLDIDKFAEQDFSGDHDKLQNDLTRPDRKVFEGGIFGYNFNLNIYSANAWAVNQYTSRHWDYYYGVKLAYTNFSRDGKMQNGRYPDNSFGKGANHSFANYTLKGGLTYKFNGRHLLTANISYGIEAPLPNDAYISPRITDKTIDDLKSGRVLAADVNYVFSLPAFTGRIGVYQTNFYDQMERNSYYDGISGTFINHVLYGVNRIHRGVEAGATYKWNEHWSFDLAGSVSEYYYSNNPMGVINSENGKIDNKQETVYMKNLYVGGLPQMAGTFGVRYFVNYWFLGANVNGFGRNFIEVAPLRRLASNYTTVNPNNASYEAYRKLTAQEEFDGGCTLDLSVGKIVYLKGKQSLNFNLSVNNVLNKRDVRTGGYEQGRMDLEYPDRFGSKYFYMQGINCFLNASYRF